MHDILDLKTFPLDQPNTAAYAALVQRCQDDLAADGMFSLAGFLKPDQAASVADHLAPKFATESFTHKRSHNIYFKKDITGLAADHPALRQVETINHTLCADQIPGSAVMQVYQFQPLVDFLAEVMQKPKLFTMDDPLACVNVMSYNAGEALNWHFDRSEFTTTLLLQEPDGGGVFEYRSGLRSDDDPNFDSVARLINGNDPGVQTVAMSPGTLNVFRGKNTAHRVTPVQGPRSRMIAVLSYYETAGMMFSDEERLGFFGRAA